MHIVIPYAAPAGASIQQTLDQVQLPHLGALLQRLEPARRITATPRDLTPLHERLRAQQTWPGAALPDGLLPWAAAEAQNCAVDSKGDSHWARLTLCHWVVHADHVAMDDPVQLQVSDGESHALQDAMRSYFAEDGITLHPLQGGTWLARGDIFKDLPTASLDRVRASKVDAWIPRQAQAKPLRRLQNEMQMLLYTHPINDARAARGLRAINAFWVSGTGELPQRATQPGEPHLPPHPTAFTEQDALRSSAVQDDPARWLQAWRSLDDGPIAAMLQEALRSSASTKLELTLCGENAAQTYALQPQSLWTRIRRRLAKADVPSLLKSL